MSIVQDIHWQDILELIPLPINGRRHKGCVQQGQGLQDVFSKLQSQTDGVLAGVFFSVRLMVYYSSFYTLV